MRRFVLLDCTSDEPLARTMVQLPGNEECIRWAEHLMQMHPLATELTITETAGGRLILRILNSERMFAKIVSI